MRTRIQETTQTNAQTHSRIYDLEFLEACKQAIERYSSLAQRHKSREHKCTNIWTHSNTSTHSQTHSQISTHKHPCTIKHTNIHTQTLTHKNSYTKTHTQTLTHRNQHTNKHQQANIHTHTHTNKYTHIHIVWCNWQSYMYLVRRPWKLATGRGRLQGAVCPY